MTDSRLQLHCACLSLPTLAVCALGIWFYVDKVPEIEKAERDRVKAEYREVARAMRQNPSGGAYETSQALPPEWRRCTAGKMSPGKWGWLPDVQPHRTLVWYDGGQGVVSTRTATIGERDYRALFLSFGSLFLFVLVGMTAVGIRYFVNYVKTRDDFLAAAAHDLTSPLVGMRFTIGRDDAQARALAERMLRLVSNIRDFLRLGGRRPAPVPEAVDVVAAYREAYALFREDYRDLFGGEDVALDAPADGLRAMCDETLTIQILWNLLGNDLKYAAPHGRVRTRIFSAGRKVCIEIADEGPGMTPRERRRAFDRYYRAKTVLESGKGGFGIGLCTAREFAQAMGGSLEVRANVPRGCVFSLSLPAAAPR